ncbi:sugar ABC transporter ATPase [Clostridium carboxidivorans P7]|uniref:ABC transporter related protein n=1 Tax=Clostridium carboxidivorans P7 TaxID=536227 RepID=C6PP01_9CLOT|nr:ABC transporter ATP-binding protein [Clostridium carboxidivorans]AKN31247.1 sugar ABC transporter ATPase [Clostridium carboxidivorans P7]EET89079.1 ABC transporter related protein [Clostridium carboxidivorans P7]EFG88366.1 ABC transporter, ATP-binding protein [Clostridium carboxidivorans P7]
MSLIIKGVNKKFISKHKETYTLDNIDLSFKKGEFICLLGPSGCGKSTLLNIIAGLETPSEGKIYLNDKEINGVGVDRAVMFQESALFPWLKVIDNVEFGMKMAGVPKKERREKALYYLKMVHLAKFKNSFVHELSGGMRQRVALARALTLDSEVLLMDEPFAALDSQTKNILQTELQKVWIETKKTIIFVTHNVEEAVLLGDRVIVMSTNPGKVKKEFKIQLRRPRNIENVDLAYVTAQVMKELKEEVEKVAKSEYDSDWSIEKNSILYSSDNDMGIGI